MAHDVFISYASEDRQVADAVCDALEGEGVRCWYAPRDVPLGANFEEAIIDAIGGCRVLILILSTHSNDSRHVQREIQSACSENPQARILPVNVDGVELSKALRFYLSSVQRLDAYTPPFKKHLPALASAVIQHLAPEADVASPLRRPVETGVASATSLGTTHLGRAETAVEPSGMTHVVRRLPLLTSLVQLGSIHKFVFFIIIVTMLALVVQLLTGLPGSWLNRLSGNSLRPEPVETPSPTGATVAGVEPRPILYSEMNADDRKKFIGEQARRITGMLGSNPYTPDPEAVNEIRFWVEAYARRVGNGKTGLWGGDTRFILERGAKYAHASAQAFKSQSVPPVIGLYLPMIESEYTNICQPNYAGAVGIFQLTPGTARVHGYSASDLCDEKKSAEMAARHMFRQVVEWGRDSTNVTFALACFNSGSAEPVRRDLRKIVNSPQKERSFWTLLAEQGRLDDAERDYIYNYVPRFFAAAIVGENPQAFGLQTRPLSAYIEDADPGKD